MMKSFALCFGIGTTAGLFAQINEDSLVRRLNAESRPVERLKLLRQLTRSSDRDAAGRYSAKTIALADSLLQRGNANDPTILSLKAAGQWNYGQSHYFQGPERNEDSLFAWYSRAAETWQRSGDKDRIAFSTMVLADWLVHRGDARGALSRLETCLRIHEELHDSTSITRDHGSIGQAYYNLSEPLKALDHYSIAVEMAQRSGNTRLAASSLCNIGLIYQEQGQSDTAIAYYERSARAYRTDPSYPGWITPVSNIISQLNARGDRSGALLRAQEVLAWPDLEQWPDEACGFYAALSSIHAAAGEQDRSMHFSERTVRMAEQGSSSARLVLALTEFGKALHREGDDPQALRQALRARALCDSLQIPMADRSSVAELLSTLYDASGRTGLAFRFYKEHVALKDSVQGEEIRKKIRSLDLRKQELADSLRSELHRHALVLAHQQEMSAEQSRKRLFMFGAIGVFAIALGLWNRLLFTRRSRAAIQREKDRSEELLLNILPHEVAEELKEKGEAVAVQIDQVTVLFTDFKGFTALSEVLTPQELVRDLNECFSAFDRITEKYGIEKIKTIGDAYMAAGGLPTPNTTHATDVIQAALEMRDFIAQGKAQKVAAGLPFFEIRIGIHTGPVVAGIVGVKKFSYDIWGDTVNTASRMESSGEVGQVNISEATFALVKNEPGLTFTSRGKVQAKGKGEMEMYFVSSG